MITLFSPVKQRAFTLIEILVVVAIIGILATAITINFDKARKQSRDKVRMTELKELQLAVEVYKAQYGQYPAQGCGVTGGSWTGRGTHPSWGVNCPEYIVGLVPDFIAELPVDPSKEDEYGKGFLYLTNAARTSYKILAYDSIESRFVTSYADEFARCPIDCDQPTYCDSTVQPTVYGVYSAGAECW